ncbi:long chain polyunsaturated fatty acid elongation enzyme [Paraphysoderma sedebokerense]|nr:long chain polyunsaturated fatty acid elongation enzyme [Paraphysoderma sedebokerense]
MYTERIADRVLDVFFALEKHLINLTSPLEISLQKYLYNNFPNVSHTVSQFLTSIRSGHADSLPLMNPFHVLVLVAAYFTIVFGGKFLMGFRQNGFQVKLYALLNNFVLVTLSLFMCVEIVRLAIKDGYVLFGNPVAQPPRGTHMAKMIGIFYCSKILEFNDTFIMVLKKNFRQISFLHVYHHFSIFMIWWMVTLWAPNGESYFSAALNSFIHVIMYSYYLFSGLGFKSVSFIRPYITRSQMTQFCCMMVQASYNMYLGFTSTPEQRKKMYPFPLSILLWVYMVSMLSLFYNFYRNSYKKNAEAKKAAKEAESKKKDL